MALLQLLCEDLFRNGMCVDMEFNAEYVSDGMDTV